MPAKWNQLGYSPRKRPGERHAHRRHEMHRDPARAAPSRRTITPAGVGEEQRADRGIEDAERSGRREPDFRWLNISTPPRAA